MIHLRMFEVEETIRNTSSRETVGPDGLPAELFKPILGGDRNGNSILLELFYPIVIMVCRAGAYLKIGIKSRAWCYTTWTQAEGRDGVRKLSRHLARARAEEILLKVIATRLSYYC